MNTKTVPYQPGSLFWGVNCLVVFPTHFNPDNFLLIVLLQISLLFRCTPAFNVECGSGGDETPR